MDGDEVFHRLVEPARLAPAVAAHLAGPDRAALLLDAAGRDLLAYTAPAAGLAAALRAGLLGTAPFAGVAARPLPAQGPRLERIPLDPRRLRPPTPCACAAIVIADGRSALLVVPAGPLPALPAALVPPSVPDVAAAPPAAPADEVARFVWASDAEGRLTRASAPLAGTVGTNDRPGDPLGDLSSDILGATWDGLLGTRVVDPEGRLAAALGRRETFRGLPLLWRVGETAEAVPATLSGAPLADDARAFAGFSGFGLLRTARREAVPPLPRVERAAPVDPPAAQPPAAAPVADESPPAPATAPPNPAAEPALPVFAAFAGATMAEFAEIVTTPLAHFGMTWGFAPPAKPSEPPRPAPEPSAPEPSEAPPSGMEPPAPDAGKPWLDAQPPAAADAETPAPPVPVEHESAPSPAASESRDDTVLSFNEHAAFREIAQRLAGRFAGGAEETTAPDEVPAQAGYGEVTPFPAHAVSRRAPSDAAPEDPVRRVLDRIPVGLLIHRGDAVLFANRPLLDLLAFPDVAELAEAGVARVLPGQEVPGQELSSRELRDHELPEQEPVAREESAAATVTLVPRTGGTVPAEALRTTLAWEGAPAALLVVRRLPEADPAQGLAAAELALRQRETRLGEARAMLDAVPDGVVTVDLEDRIVDFNQGARDLFGHDPREVVGEPVAFLFAPRDRARALAFLHRVRGAGVSAVLDPEVRGRDVHERPIVLSAAPLAADAPGRLGLVLRDVTALRRAEADLRAAGRAAEAAGARKADLFAAVAQGVRPPLDRIAALAASLLEAPAGAPDETRERLVAIQAAGIQVTGLVDDLADLAKIEAGRAELAFTGVALNDLVARCVALMQPEAVRERIVVRTSFAPNLPAVLADEGAMRRAALNVIGDAIRLTEPGGQVIVSTALSERGEVALRVRDTGAGMTPEEVRAALAPTGGRAPGRRSATGLGLPLTKALVEANRGSLQVTSGKDEGTLVEVVFPPGRVLAG